VGACRELSTRVRFSARLGGKKEKLTFIAEHVFEGQLIGDFFTWWLDQGKANAYAAKSSTSKNISCANTEILFTKFSSTFPWENNGVKVPFIEQVLYQLGNEDHLDRLTIFMGRPNLRKGIVSPSFFFYARIVLQCLSIANLCSYSLANRPT
jgi:hypothetical protein